MKQTTKNIVFASLPFGWVALFWYVYDQVIQTINVQTFAIGPTLSGFIVALDNIIGLAILPLFGILTDRTHTSWGKRTPYIFYGTIVSMLAFLAVGLCASYQAFWGYILSLLVCLVAMAAYRPAAYALVPDITPEPQRSAANAVTNMVGVVFNLIAILITAFFLTKSNIAKSNYLPIFALVVLFSIVAMCIYMKSNVERRCSVVEPKTERQKEKDAHIEKQIPPAETKPLHAKAQKRNKFLILVAVFVFYMAFNAIMSNLTNYATYVLHQEWVVLPAVVTLAGGALGMYPAATWAAKRGRKSTMLTGFFIMFGGFLPIALLSYAKDAPSIVATLLMYLCFAVVGFGYSLIMVNIYPLFLEYGGEHIGGSAGIYSSIMTVAMVITPILSGMLIEWSGGLLGVFYITAEGISKCGDFRVLAPYCGVNLLAGIIAIFLMYDDHYIPGQETDDAKDAVVPETTHLVDGTADTEVAVALDADQSAE